MAASSDRTRKLGFSVLSGSVPDLQAPQWSSFSEAALARYAENMAGLAADGARPAGSAAAAAAAATAAAELEHADKAPVWSGGEVGMGVCEGWLRRKSPGSGK